MTPPDTTPIEPPLVIAGETVPAGECTPVHDPAQPADVVGRAPAATAEQARAAVDAASRAFSGWQRLRPAERADTLVDALGSLAADNDERVDLLVRENGKPRAEATVELQVFEARCRLAASLAPLLEDVEDLPGPPGQQAASSGRQPQLPAPPFRSKVHALPVGVTTIVIPYNWPLAILAASLPYALVAGNPVNVKPPPTTPLSVLTTLAHLASRLPPGVLNVVSGANEAVALLIEDPRVRKLVFTGSTGGGRTMMTMAAKNLTRVTLELGGNDPAIVLDDAVLDDAALERLATGAFLTAGQVCMGIKRIYVHRSRYDELVEGLGDALASYQVGHGLDPATTMGPLNNARQRDFVVELREDARAQGAEIRELGNVDPDGLHAGGYFLPPTLVLSPPREARIVTEEQFGPALPILPFDDEVPLVDALNNEWAGLCSSVWTGDAARADDLAARLRTGTTWVNCANAVAQDDRAPFGGFRQSGIGRELGADGLLDFTEAHTVTYPAPAA